MKNIGFTIMALVLIAGMSACHCGKKTTGTYTWSLYKELRDQLPEATVLPAGDTVRVIYPELVMFDFGKYEIKQEALPSFTRFANLLKGYGRIHFLINGYTDNIGGDDVNLELSRNRAESAERLMSSNGVSTDRMATKGLGASNPLKPNTTTEGRQANRRVEFLLYDTVPVKKK